MPGTGDGGVGRGRGPGHSAEEARVVDHWFRVGSGAMTTAAGPRGSIANPIPRQAARVLLIDAEGRCLLFRGLDPGRPGSRYWFTAGGGLVEGETPAQGAVRELYEETGLAIDPDSLGDPIWRDTTQFPFAGRWFSQEQDYFVVRVAEWTVTSAGFGLDELRSIDGHRWWSVADLDTTAERFYPGELPGLLREILDR